MPGSRRQRLPLLILVCAVALSGAVGAAPASAAYRDTVASTPGLVSHWRLGETSGVSAVDQQASNNGTYLGSLSLGAPGLLANDGDASVTLDGVNDVVKVPNSVSLAVSSSLTVEAWVKRSSTANPQTLFDKGHYFANFMSSGRVQFGVYTSAGWVQLVSPSNSIASGTTYHLAFTWDGAALRIYKNGVEIASKPATGTSPLGTSYNLIVGADSNGYDAIGEYFAGTVDELAVYSRALSLSEVRQHFAAGLGDTGPPETTIDSGPSGTINSAGATFAFSSSEAGSSFECRLDGGVWSSCSSPKSYSGLAVGSHTFEARATDAVWNTDLTPASRSWTFEPDVTPPETTISAGPADPAPTPRATFEFSSSEAGSTFECRLDGGTWAGCSSPKSYSGLADGPHTFEARATDQNLNTDATAASRTWTVAISPYASAVRGTSGLVGYWRLGETSGSVAIDETGTNDGAYLGASGLGADGLLAADPDRALGLDGIDDHVRVPDNSTLDTVSGLTWEGWIKPSAPMCGRYLFIRSPTVRASFGCNDDLRFIVNPNGVSTDLYTPPQSFAAGQTYHVALTWDGATMRIFKNGAEVASRAAPGTLANTSYNLIIGAESGGYDARGDYYPGAMDEVALYGRALTPAEIERHNDVGLDPVPPETTINSGPANNSSSSTATFEFTSSEAASTFECRIDGSAWNACTSPRTYTDLDDGEHGFDVRATDAVGNVDPSPAERTWSTSIFESPPGDGLPPDRPADLWVPNGPVHAAVASGHGSLYLGGEFTRVGPYTGSGVALDDQAEPTGTRAVNGQVYAVAADGNGGWYIGGNFTRVGTLAREGLAHISRTGAVDPDWNPATNDIVRALTFSGGVLYVGGDFTSVGGEPRAKLAAIDTAGTVTGWDPGVDGRVLALAARDATIYVGGPFDAVGDLPRENLAAVTVAGTVTSWNPGADDEVFALATFGSTVYAGGAFTSVDGEARNHLAAITVAGAATDWNPNSDGVVKALAAAEDVVYVGGRFASVGGVGRNNVAAIDAAEGTPKDWNANANDDVTAIALTGATVYLGGAFTEVAGETRNRLAAVHASGAGLAGWDPRADGQVHALAAANSIVYAGGEFASVGGVARKNLAEVDLSTGQASGWNPAADEAVYALERVGATVFAGGDFATAGGQARDRLAAIDADGAATSWNPGADGSVYGLDSSGSTVYISGVFTSVGGQSRSHLAAVEVDGTVKGWAPNPNQMVNALAASGSTVYVAGDFSSVGGESRSGLVAVDASGSVMSWDPDPNGSVYSLLATDSKLYVGGSFGSIGGESRTRLAELNASDATATGWNPQADGSVDSLGRSGSTVYVGGSFTSVGGQDREGLASVDASTGAATRWDPGNSGYVTAFVAPGGSVYVAGKYGTLGRAETKRPNLAGFVVAPSNETAPALSAAPVVGESVTTSDGSWHDAAAYSYQWLRSGQSVAGAQASSYTPTGEDTARPLAARVTASNLAGSTSGESAAQVVGGAPVNDTAPAIVGTAEVGKVLSASDGAWRADPAATAARQWRRCSPAGDECADIDGAHGPTYRALHVDTGKTLRYAVSQTNSRGSLTVSSAPTAAIAPTELPVVTLSHDPALAAGWVNSYEDALTVSATDSAPGVAKLEVATGEGAPQEFTHACASEAVGCPETLEHVFDVSGAGFPDGENTVTALARDGAGNVSDPERYTVKLDSADPSLSTSGPLEDAAGQSLHPDTTLTLDVSAADALAGVANVEILVDGERAAFTDQECAAGGCGLEDELTVDLSQFDRGMHAVKVVASDHAGNAVEETWQLSTKDGVAPEITLSGSLADLDGESVTEGTQYDLHAVATDGTAEEPQSGVGSLEILVGEDSKELVTVPCPDGNCSLSADYELDPADFTTGGHTVRVRATDESGETAESTLIVIVHRPPAAPPLDETAATPISESTDFLYTGTNPIQTGVDAGTIEDTRAALIRGRVLTEDGAPLPDVEVTVDGHPELGSTESQADGEVYLAVNGGGPLTLRFTREAGEYMPADRTIEVPWQGYAQFDDVRLLEADPNVDVVDLSGEATSMQSVAGPTSSDGNGSRRPVLLFAPGTHAEVPLTGEEFTPLDGADTAHIRLTEYTVGNAGPEALPGELPTQTAYTYAAEFSIDEAADAETVRFTDGENAPKPAISYNENFLDFAVGSTVPSGYYDRERAVWVPEDSGRVVEVIGHTPEGAAIVDVTGAGNAATAAELAELEITDPELAELGPLYTDGTELWRVPLSHLSAHDFNMSSYRPPDATTPPGSAQLAGPGGPDNPNCTSGSIILCETQALGEQVPVTGTPFSLVYQSDRVPGRKSERKLEIPLSDANMPESVKRIDLTIEIAGRTIRSSFPDERNQTHTFTWDGKDEFGRTVQGAQEAMVTVDHVYSTRYTTPTRFGSPGRTDEVGEARAGAGGEIDVSQTSKMIVSNWDATKLGLGGWTLDAHHAYDPVSRILHRGDGGRQSAESVNRAIRGFAGGRDPNTCAATQLDGRTVRQGKIGRGVEGMELAADGTLYFAGNYDAVWKVTPDGYFRHVAGRPACAWWTGQPTYGGDGGPAEDAYFASPKDVAVDERGGVFIVDQGNHRIRYVDPAGTITTIAGNGTAGFSGDGGRAVDAQLNRPHSIELAPDGTLYVSDTANKRIRQITTDGRIDTFAGDPAGVVWENARATRTAMNGPTGLSLAEDGSLYVVTDDRVRRISVGDRVETVVGVPRKPGEPAPWKPRLHTPEVNGLPASEVRVEGEWVAVAPDGGLYVHDYHTVKKISADGRVEPGAGVTPQSGAPFAAFDTPQPAGSTQLACPSGLAVGPSGELFLGESCEGIIDVVDAGMPKFSGEELAVPSKDGEEIYKFSKEGRHLETLDALTGGVQLTFDYDGAGRLTSVTDGDGDVTELERNAAGDPVAVVSADEDQTPLTLGADGLLSRIENPKGEAHRMTYAPGGLLASFTDPRNHASTFQYDSLGRLERDDDAAGGFKTLTRSGGRDTYDVTVETKMGRATKHRVEPRPAGGTLRTKTDPVGLVTTTDEGSDGTTKVTGPDGTTGTSQTKGDPRFGTQSAYVSRAEVRTPGGRSRVVATSRATTGATPGNPLAFTQLTDTTTVNGRNWTTVFDRPSSSFTSTSPSGRSSVTTVDGQRRPLTASVPGLTTTTYTYDERGRPWISEQGARTTLVSYDTAGNVDTETDSLGRTTTYDHDAVGRVEEVQLPGGRTVGYEYDEAGNLTGITPPGRTEHLFSFGATGLLDHYDPPDVAGTAFPTTHYSYDEDHNLKTIDRPDRAAPITFHYDDDTGRFEGTSAPTGSGGATEATTYAYDPVSGHLDTITAPSGQVLTFDDDGPLPLEQALTGDVEGRVNQGYDAEQRLASETVNGAHAVSYSYDADDLLSGVGALTIDRDPVVDGIEQKNGLVASTVLGSISESRTYNTFGEPSARVFSAGGQQLFASDVTRDDGGRIEAKTETMGTAVTGFAYTYDPDAGWLTDVSKTAPGGAVTETHYDYDPNGNGNRTERTRGAETTYYSYDGQDRLTRAGTVDFSYDANGQLTRRQDSANTADDTRYGYDAYGQLRDVELPDGRDLRYVLDGAGRRVGKKVDGALVQGFLYSGGQLVAELNSDDSVRSRFVYATRSHVPDYMVKGGVTYRFVTDELGSPRLVVNAATGEVVQELEYDEFGVVTADSNPGFQPFGYAGGLYDRDTKLTHFGAREYDPETGRWTAKDPIGFGGGDTNLYGYVFSDPINLIDPSGLVSWPSFEAVATGFASFGDTYTLGATKALRGAMGWNEGLNFCSDTYLAVGALTDQAPLPGPAKWLKPVKGVARFANRGKRVLTGRGGPGTGKKKYEAVKRLPNSTTTPDPRYPGGEWTTLPNGTKFGHRSPGQSTSKTDTLDVAPPGGPHYTIHFP